MHRGSIIFTDESRTLHLDFDDTLTLLWAVRSLIKRLEKVKYRTHIEDEALLRCKRLAEELDGL